MSDDFENIFKFLQTKKLNYSKPKNDLLRSFCAYIYSSSDYIYNESYLLDKISGFWDAMQAYGSVMSKSDIIEKIINEKNLFQKSYDFEIVIDDIIVIKNNEKGECKRGISDKYRNNKKVNKDLYIKVLVECNGREFKEYFEVEKDEDEHIEEIGNKICNFIKNC